jgi:hypothetical protein
MIAVQYERSALVQRLLLRAAPEVNRQELRRLNYSERRGAAYLLFAVQFPIDSGDEELTIWQRLKKHGDQQLVKEIVSFL